MIKVEHRQAGSLKVLSRLSSAHLSIVRVFDFGSVRDNGAAAWKPGGGKLIAPVGSGDSLQELRLFEKAPDGRITCAVPLRYPTVSL